MMMFKIKFTGLIVTFSLLVFSSIAFAQGGFGGFTYKIESIGSSSMMSVGGGGAWLVTPNFYLGGAGAGSMNSIHIRSNTLSSMGYGGLMMGYKTHLISSFGIGGQVMLGSGSYTYRGTDEGFRFVEPALQGWLRINSFMQLNVGIQYRLPFMNAENLLKSNDLEAMGMQISLFFGSF